MTEVNMSDSISKIGIKQIKLIVSDLDGTLLDKKGRIDTQTASLLLDFQKQGGILVLATSRHLSECKAIASSLLVKEKGYLISSNGVYLYDSLLSLLRAFDTFSLQDCFEIQSFFNNMPMTLVTDGTDLLVGKEITYRDRLINFIVNHRGRSAQKRHYFDMRMANSNSYFIEKIIVSCPSCYEIPQKILDEYNLVYQGLTHIELQRFNTDKYNALMFLAEKNGILPKEILAFGDDDNDYRMISSLPYGIAMGNAKERIKSAAKMVISSNENRGLYRALKGMI